MEQEYTVKNNAKEASQSYALRTRNQIESELAKLVQDLSKLKLQPQIKYAVLSQGKRLRPLLVILSAQSVGGDSSKVMRLALAFEFMHTATLAHDDVIDQDEMRRDRLALHKKWSVDDAILTGDALVALAVDLASSYGETVLKAVAQSALELCDGERMDITLSLETTTEESYFKRIKKKSASLFRAATFCGALAGGGTSTELEALSAFGENFGIAYQLRDDLLDLSKEGTPALRELKNGRITLPLIHSYKKSSDSEKSRLNQSLASHDSDVNGWTSGDILEILTRTGSLDYCEKKIEQYLKQAVSSLSALRNSEYKSHMIEMTKALGTQD